HPLQPLSAFDGQSLQGTWTLQVLDTATGNVGALNSWSLHASQAIPDTGPGTLLSPLTIPPSANPITIGNLTVNLSLKHPNLTDLSIFLISPGPSPVQIPLVPVGALTGQNLVNTTFDDTATKSLNQGSAPYSELFRPAQPLASFRGLQFQGTWFL